MKILSTIAFVLSFCLCLSQSKKVLSDEITKEFASTLSGSDDYLIFQSNKDNGFQLYESTRIDNRWSSPKRILFDTNWTDFPMIGGPSLSKNADTLFFCAQLENGFGDLDIYFSVKNDGVWGTPNNIGPNINTAEFEGFPSISPNGNELFYTKSIPTGSESTCQEIFVAIKDKSGNWRDPRPLPSRINAGCVKAPTILKDNKTLIFSAKIAPKNDAFYLYKSVREQNGKWAKPELMPLKDNSPNPQHLSLSSDGSWGIFTSGDDLIETIIPVQSRPYGKFIYNGLLQDKETKSPIGGLIIVQEIDGRDTLLKTQLVNEDGAFSIALDLKKAGAIEFNSTGHRPQLIKISTDNEIELPETISLQPKRKTLDLNIADAETGTGLNVDIKITNLSIDEEINLNGLVGRDGKYAVDLREGDKYSIEIKSREGYAFANETIFIEQEPQTSALAKQLDLSKLTTTHLQHITTPIDVKNAVPVQEIADLNSVVETGASSITIPIKPLITGTTLNLKHIYFDVESYQLTEASSVELGKLADLLKTNPTIKIEIAAHTDQDGSAKYNLKLSEKRAQSVLAYLKNLGIAETRVVAKGYGESQPISKDSAKNRRVELKVID